jgi:hypothetical protein
MMKVIKQNHHTSSVEIVKDGLIKLVQKLETLFNKNLIVQAVRRIYSLKGMPSCQK